MIKHLVVRSAVSLLLSIGLSGCGGGGGSSSGGVSTQPDEGSLEDSGSPMTPGELSNAGDSTLTDGDPAVDAPVVESPDAVTPDAETPDSPPLDDAPSSAAGSVDLIAGLWDDSFTYPDGRVNITYLEITGDGGYITHDYRGDSFDLGQNCYETVEGVISAEGDGSYRAVILGEESRFEATSSAGQLQVTFLEGGMTSLSAVTGLSTSDFNDC